ncbi:hypothetical protein GOBAR_AA13259 [Gossypium barbadense]|uniref:Uncharacterized protein n=1 Tax=Gossypium barbadense TaxID=3634 RepID=A0A2P5XVL9_GOSBA|nr:hypothetical protein GOBAR_AA13259 [Gossypium barbadense]
MSSSRGKKTAIPTLKKRKGAASSSVPTAEIRHLFLQAALEQIQLADTVRALLITDLWGLFFEIVEPTYVEFTLELYSMFDLQTVMTNFDDPGIVQFRLGGLVCQLGVPKASALPLSLRYLQAILAHTLTGTRESTDIVNTHDSYFLWCMANGHVVDLAYFISLPIRHQTE